MRGTGDSFGRQICPLPTDGKPDWLDGDAFRNGAREKHLAKNPNTLLTWLDVARLSTAVNISSNHQSDERLVSSRSDCSLSSQARLGAIRTPWLEATAGTFNAGVNEPRGMQQLTAASHQLGH